MYKQVMLLGLLLEQPMYGQQIREVIEQHHDAYADLIKKPTIYYLLERLAQDGYLEVRREAVNAPGTGSAHDEVAPREREVYHITEAGRQRFYTLLNQVLRSYEPAQSAVDVGLFFMRYLAPDQAAALLRQRRAVVAGCRMAVVEQCASEATRDAAHAIVNDHTLTLLDAELGWLDRAVARLEALAVGRQAASAELAPLDG